MAGVKKTKTSAKKTAATKTTAKTTAVKKPAATRGGPNREVNPETGFVVGTDQDLMASALLSGGPSRSAIAESLEKTIDTTTRNGTPKQISNMLSGVITKMIANGFTVESNFQLLPPTPASKRAATRAANKAAAAPVAKTTKPAAKKAPAKKTAAKGKGAKTAAK